MKRIILVIVAVLMVYGGYVYFIKAPVVIFSESEARVIAQNTCIKGGGGGSLAQKGYYNENSKTWWFDANLNATKQGCSPACVVSEETKQAEINYRCTGLIQPESRAVQFDVPITMQVGDIVKFPNDLTMTLKQINDSRCKPGVQCVWAGELAVVLATGVPGDMNQIQLGTVNNKSVTDNGFSFTLQNATETTATIVAVQLAVGTSGISGYVHVGPVCPVEKNPPDPACADRPLSNTKIEISSVNGDVQYATTDTTGNFKLVTAPKTYYLRVQLSAGLLPSCPMTTTFVKANQFTTVDISCDSGIR